MPTQPAAAATPPPELEALRNTMKIAISGVVEDLNDDEADREFGRTLREEIEARNGAGTGRQFRDSVITATRPGTAARAEQDRAFNVLAGRLGKVVRGAA